MNEELFTATTTTSFETEEDRGFAEGKKDGYNEGKRIARKDYKDKIYYWIFFIFLSGIIVGEFLKLEPYTILIFLSLWLFGSKLKLIK
jgi:hypothetical protein